MIAEAMPAAIVFSAFGLREGRLFDMLPATARRSDPLLDACAQLATQAGRFGDVKAMVKWIAPLFEAETPSAARLREAACLLSDLCWNEHPDYRAEHALRRVMRLPLTAIDHPGRVFLASALFTRYSGRTLALADEPALALISPDKLALSSRIGLALRLAHTLTGGAAGLLISTSLHITSHAVELHLWNGAADLAGDVVQRRLDAVAAASGRAGLLVVDPPQAPQAVSGAVSETLPRS